MNTVTITDSTLRVEPTGLDKLWSFTRHLDVPLDHVRGATFDPGANTEPKGVRRPGLAIPGKWSGAFSRQGSTAFWNVSGHGRTIVVELTCERYQRLFLSVEDPRTVVDTINAAIS
jgi:hypothetical protein